MKFYMEEKNFNPVKYKLFQPTHMAFKLAKAYLDF